MHYCQFPVQKKVKGNKRTFKLSRRGGACRFQLFSFGWWIKKSNGGNLKSARSCSFLTGGSPLSEAGECCYCVPIFFLPCLFNQKRIRKWGREREKTFSPDLFGKTMPKMPEPEIEGSIIQRTHKRPRMFVLFVCGIYQRRFFETGLAICRADYTHRPIPYSDSQERNHKELLWWVSFMRWNIYRYKFWKFQNFLTKNRFKYSRQISSSIRKYFMKPCLENTGFCFPTSKFDRSATY